MLSRTKRRAMSMLLTKPPAVLVQVLERYNYMDTVAFIKSAVDFPAQVEEIHNTRRIREGTSSSILRKKHGSQAAVSRLEEAIKSKHELWVGRSGTFGTVTQVKIKDIYPTESKKDVLKAIKNAVPTDAGNR